MLVFKNLTKNALWEKQKLCFRLTPNDIHQKYLTI